jgi:hypothetical protein
MNIDRNVQHLGSQEETPNITSTRSDTPNDIIKSVISAIIDESNNINGEMVPARGALTRAAKTFNVSKNVVSRIWSTAKSNHNNQSVLAYRASPKKKGRKKYLHLKYNRDEVEEEIKKLPPKDRKTIRSMSSALGIPTTTIHRMYRDDNIVRKINNKLKPYLNDNNKLMRLLYAFEQIKGVRINDKLFFDDYYNEVHVDEKWFYITEREQHLYITNNEVAPHRTVVNKQHIIKIMFLCAVARPRFDEAGNCTFDGKIGMWPFVDRIPAARTSINRERGTLETKCINVTATTYYNYFTTKLVPAIKQFFPRQHNNNMPINIQHDNAPSHFSNDNGRWKAFAADQVNWQFKIKEQPANSPDCNVLDLGFFASIQSIQWQSEPATTIDGLIVSVMTAWQQYNPRTLECVWITHQACLNEVIACYGDNTYQLPHLGKHNLRDANGNLPSSIDVSDEAEEALESSRLYDVPGFDSDGEPEI